MKKICMAMILLCTLLVGCKPEPEKPTVITKEVSDITADSAKVIYNVTDDGGAEITSHGVCWSMSQNPTINDNKTNEGNSIGTFSTELYDLISDTTYYVRAYAVNSVGISYGEEKNFKTLNDNTGDDNNDDNTGDDNNDDNTGDDNNEEETVDNKTITVNGVSFTMIAVEGGTFNMGAQNIDPDGINYDEEAWDREAPVHSVTLSDYYIGETEVTQELWQAVMGYNPSHFSGAQKPVEQISWYDCQNFINQLNQLTDLKFRLLTEAEWEYAARGGNKSQGYKYSGSDVLDDVAWFKDNAKSKSQDVKTKAPNELGVYDMCGNVLEWCQDLFGNYSGFAQTDPTGALSGTDYVIRGGSCLSTDEYCRLSIRSFLLPGGMSYGIGFRIAM